MWNEYAREKLDEIEREMKHARASRPSPHVSTARPERRGIVRPVARAAGRRVRRFGEALEGWASAPRNAGA
jgi:hypothetical protein